MEDMDFGRASIDNTTTTSSDESTEKSVDTARQTSIDDTSPEAGKFSLTYNTNKGVVLGEPKGQLSNANNQITNEQGTAIPVQINSISKKDHEWKLPLQDYLNRSRTYSNRSANKLAKDDAKESGVSLEYLFMRGRRVDSVDGSPLAKIKESLDSFHSVLEEQNQFGIYQIDDDTLSELEHQVDFVDNQTLKNKYPIPNPNSFTQSYDDTVGSRRGRAKFRLNQAFTGNRKLATDLNGKIDIMFSELMRKFDALSERIKRLDGQVAENATAIKREAGRLPRRTDANLKRQVNAVLLRSGERLIPSTIEINNAEKHAVVEETGENRSRPIILDDPNTDLETPQEKELPNTKEVAIDLEEEEVGLEEDVEIDRQERINVDRHTTVNIDRQCGNNVVHAQPPAEPAMERVYMTLPPFPPNKTQTKRELDKAICKKAFDKITLEMPLNDPLEKILTSSEEQTFSVNSRAEEYTRLMDASMEIANVDDIEDDT
ncbi:hypothetical protein DY000_02007775 [Brassica cretica]|uniref:Uncharacterized protein n=1 Tax=Brassica cretica TaxID=69181 RepID=A0ABQ7CIX2_BRACR|nr:hypothetical protein DY000_02007775 [Brassica cretica]